MPARRGVSRRHTCLGATASSATLIPLIIQTASALSHIARPSRKQPQKSRRGRGLRKKPNSSAMAESSRRCCNATGPQSKMLVSRYRESTASRPQPNNAARSPAIRRNRM